MKTFISICISLIVTATLFGQITYETGFYIDNNGNKHDGLIKNIDWLDSPSSFEFKTNQNAKSETRTLNNTTAFGIGTGLYFEKHTVKVDKEFSIITEDRRPKMVEKTAFLRLIAEGEISLFKLVDNNSKTFFIQNKADKTPEQLIYKKYYASESLINTNERYKQQLNELLTCTKTSINFDKVKYNSKSLIALINKELLCLNPNHNTTDFNSKGKNRAIKINGYLRLGARVSYYNSGRTRAPFSGKTTSFYPGLGAEFTLPFNKNKWSMILEFAYSNFNLETETEVISLPADVSFNFEAIEIILGARHYMFVNPETKFHLGLNISYPIVQLKTEQSIRFFKTINTFLPSASLMPSLGISYKNTTFDVRYGLPAKLTRLHLEESFNFLAASLSYKF